MKNRPHLRFTHYLLVLFLLLSIPANRLDGNQQVEKTRVVIMIGEQEYETKDSLPVFARENLSSDEFDVTIIHVNPSDSNDFPGLIGALEKADVLLISVRRRTPPRAQMEAIKKFLIRKGNIVGIRTSSHAFGRKPVSDNHVKWDEFDRDVFGMDYLGHYGNKPPQPLSRINIVSYWNSHLVLDGLDMQYFYSTSHLYKNEKPGPGVSVLMSGQIGDNGKKLEPVTWVREYKNGRVFYTSLGNPEDFKKDAFKKLLVNAIRWSSGK